MINILDLDECCLSLDSLGLVEPVIIKILCFSLLMQVLLDFIRQLNDDDGCVFFLAFILSLLYRSLFHPLFDPYVSV